MTNFSFRLYGLSTCPICQHAFDYLRSSGVPLQYVLADGDPIALEGALKVTGSNAFPLLETTATGELLIVKGFQELEYARLVRAFAASVSAKPAYKVVDASQPAGAPQGVAQSPQRPNGGTVTLPAVSRPVDDAGSTGTPANGGVGAGRV